MKTNRAMTPVARLLLGVSLFALPMVSAAVAEDCNSIYCYDIRGRQLDDSTTQKSRVNENQEAADTAAPGQGGELFSISVDGEHVAGTPVPRDGQRTADRALEAVDIQVKFDGLDIKPVLNVATVEQKRNYGTGDTVNFLASSNYQAWMANWELRIFKSNGSDTEVPFAIIAVTAEGVASWVVPEDSNAAYTYVLRAYDSEKRWDETAPLTLHTGGEEVDQQETDRDAVAPGFGEDRTAIRNIPVYGGSVTVFGSNVPAGQLVTVMGEVVPVDENNRFVVQRLLPPGDHNINVGLRREGDAVDGLFFNREINIPENEWFYVALADFTLGKRFGSGVVEDVTPGEFDDVYTKGRLAFYLKGKIKGRYLLTAAADTGENSIEAMFQGFDKKDPKSFLRRLDPDDYYPVYGDDSTTVEDAPTRGKFYIKLARGDSHVMWGNFKTEIKGTQFLRNERALYGASAVFKSEKAVPAGERATTLQVYAAQPGTLPQRDVLRGTGGSAYFLKHQAITVGSETVTVEIRDNVTGRVVTRTQLRFGQDYEIDYLQGVILLKKPLPSTAGDGDIVQSGSNPVQLVVNYEFTPAAGDVDGYVYGGRAQQWMGDHIRIGVTGAKEKTGAADQKMAGADITIWKSDQTFFEFEYARSKGPGFGRSVSADGGLTVADEPTAGRSGKAADALRLHGRVGLEDLAGGDLKGHLEGYFERREAGFSSLDQQVTADEKKWGASIDLPVQENADFKLAYDEIKVKNGKRDRELNAELDVEFMPQWHVAGGVKNFRRNQPAGTRNGERTDLGVKLSYEYDDDHAAFVFGQKTVARRGDINRNNRVGAGILFPVTDKVDLGAEASVGSTGFGGKLTADYQPNATDHYYLGYHLDPDRENSESYPHALSGDDLGAIVAGARHRYSESLAIFAEDNYDMFGQTRSLTQTYGVNYTPNPVWTVGGNIEMGDIIDDTVNAVTGLKNSDFERTAVSASVGYRPSDKADAHVKAEARFENSEDGTRDRESYYLAAGLSLAFNDNWRLLTNLDAVISDASSTQLDGDYIEGSAGYAYRPVDNDAFNALVKYTFLYDLPGPDQVTQAGTTLGPAQRSHIFSADASYDINEIVTIGAKYGFRIGETRARAAGSAWDDSSAHLGVIRADIAVVRNWDALIEGRAMWVNGDSVDFGFLTAVYRHMGDNFKVGVGYNFGHFSDDLRDLTADDHGIFINAIGQF